MALRRWVGLTFPDLRTESNVLGHGAFNLLLWCHVCCLLCCRERIVWIALSLKFARHSKIQLCARKFVGENPAPRPKARLGLLCHDLPDFRPSVINLHPSPLHQNHHLLLRHEVALCDCTVLLFIFPVIRNQLLECSPAHADVACSSRWVTPWLASLGWVTWARCMLAGSVMLAGGKPGLPRIPLDLVYGLNGTLYSPLFQLFLLQ